MWFSRNRRDAQARGRFSLKLRNGIKKYFQLLRATDARVRHRPYGPVGMTRTVQKKASHTGMSNLLHHKLWNDLHTYLSAYEAKFVVIVIIYHYKMIHSK